MADQQNTSLIFLKSFFQFCFCVNIEVVGRLVQQQNIALTVQNFAETYFCLLAAAQYTHLTLDVFGGQTAFCQHGTDLVLCHCRKFAPDLFDTGRSVLRIGLLLKITDMLIIAKMHFAGIRFDQLQNAF